MHAAWCWWLVAGARLCVARVAPYTLWVSFFACLLFSSIKSVTIRYVRLLLLVDFFFFFLFFFDFSPFFPLRCFTLRWWSLMQTQQEKKNKLGKWTIALITHTPAWFIHRDTWIDAISKEFSNKIDRNQCKWDSAHKIVMIASTMWWGRWRCVDDCLMAKWIIVNGTKWQNKQKCMLHGGRCVMCWLARGDFSDAIGWMPIKWRLNEFAVAGIDAVQGAWKPFVFNRIDSFERRLRWMTCVAWHTTFRLLF